MLIPALEFEAAQRIVVGAIEAAQQQGIAVAVTVVDGGGHLLAFVRMDGVGPMAIGITRRKAISAWSFRMPTKAIATIGNFDPVAGADIAKNPEICAVPGGMPIIIDGQCVGGLGVGGGRSEQDQAIAEAALQAIF